MLHIPTQVYKFFFPTTRELLARRIACRALLLFYVVQLNRRFIIFAHLQYIESEV